MSHGHRALPLSLKKYSGKELRIFSVACIKKNKNPQDVDLTGSDLV
jgi:hypothetical protein